MQGNGIFKFHNFQLKFSEDVQLRFLSLFLEFERLTRFLVNFGSYGQMAVGVQKSVRKMGFSNSITFTSKYQNQLKFLEDVQLRFLSLFLEFERLAHVGEIYGTDSPMD